MHLGVLLRHLGPHTDFDTVRAAARSADVLGYHSLWAVDPRLAPPSAGGGSPAGIAPIAALIEAAECTERIQLGLHLIAGREGPSGPDPMSIGELPASLVRRLTVALDVGDAELDDPADDTQIDDTQIDDIQIDDIQIEESLSVVRPQVRSLLVSTRSPDRWGRFAPSVDGWFLTGAAHGLGDIGWPALLESAVAGALDPATFSLVVRADVVLAERPLSRHRSTFCGSVEQVVDDLVEVGKMGADSAVLAVGLDRPLDEVLGGYAAIAEGLELRSLA